MSQRELGLRAGLSASSMSMYERGERIPDMETLEALADYFNVDTDYLLGRSNVRNSYQLEMMQEEFEKLKGDILTVNTVSVPLLGSIACGEPKLTNRTYDLYVDPDDNVQADFCLIASGDSMIDARIYDGDIVFIRQQDIVENGEIAAVVIGDEATLKKCYYYPEKNLMILKAANPNYDDFIYSDEDLSQVHIIGKAVALQTRL